MVKKMFIRTRYIMFAFALAILFAAVAACSLTAQAARAEEQTQEHTGTLFAFDAAKAVTGEQKWTIVNARGFISQNVPVDGEMQYGAVAPTGQTASEFTTPMISVSLDKYTEVTVSFRFWNRVGDAGDILTATLYYSDDYGRTYKPLDVTVTHTGKIGTAVWDGVTYTGEMIDFNTGNLCELLPGKKISYLRFYPHPISRGDCVRIFDFKVTAKGNNEIVPEDPTLINDAPYIQGLINNAKAAGQTEVTIPSLNPRDNTAYYIIGSTIKLPSDMTVYIDNCTLRLADGVFCNIFANETAWNETLTAEEEQRNIKIIGKGENATLDGGKHNGLTELTVGRYGMPDTMAVNCSVLFRNVNGLEVANLTIVEPRYWSFLNTFCSNGIYRDIRFAATNYVRNQDGIDLRIGCNHFEIYNITGDTGDDVIALTALAGDNRTFGFGVEGKDSDIHDVNIHDINARSVAGFFIVRLLMQDGNKIYNVEIDKVHDRHIDTNTRAGAVVYGGEVRFFSEKEAQPGDLHDVTITNVETNCHNAAILVAHPAIRRGDITYSNVVNTVNGRAIDWPSVRPPHPDNETLYGKDFLCRDDAEGWVSNVYTGPPLYFDAKVDGKQGGYITFVEYDAVIQFISPDMHATVDKYKSLRLDFDMWVNEIASGPDPEPTNLKLWYSTDFGDSWTPIDATVTKTDKRVAADGENSGYIYRVSTGELTEKLAGKTVTGFKVNPYGRELETGSPKLVNFKVTGELKEGETVRNPVDMSKALVWSTTDSGVGESAHAALDGNADTAWHAQSGALPQTLLVDLGDEKDIASVDIVFGSAAAWQYNIYYSADGVVWKSYAAKAGNTFESANYTETKDASARYVAVEVVGTRTVSIAELRVNNDAGENIARKCPCAATSHTVAGGSASAAFDGNAGTRWCASSSAMPQQLMADLGSVETVNGLRIVLEQPSVVDFVAETSTDGVEWLQYAASNTQGQIFDFDAEAEARYIRIEFNGAESGAWASVWELQVFTEKAPTYMIDGIVLSSPHALSVTTEHGVVVADKTVAYVGEKVNLTVTPDAGYVLAEIKANDIVVTADVRGKYSFTMPDGDCEITASFVPKTVLPSHALTVMTAENGTVRADRSTAKAGETVTLVVTPAQGYKVGWVKVNGTIVLPTEGEYGFLMPDGDCDIAASFVAVADPSDKPTPDDPTDPVKVDVDMSELTELTRSVKTMQTVSVVLVSIVVAAVAAALAVAIIKGKKREK